MQDIGGVGVLENLYDEAISSIWSRVRLHLDQKSSEPNAGHKYDCWVFHESSRASLFLRGILQVACYVILPVVLTRD